MIIESDYLTEGLFGQIFIWMLEILPYIDSKQWKPEWRIRTKNYGEPPEYNIFPGIVRATYKPESNGNTLSFEDLQYGHKYNFRQSFRSASEYWNSNFRFPEDVYDRLEQFWQTNFAGETVLGVHYRGTDKNVDHFQTDPVSQYQLLCVVEDFLKTHADVTAIFVATDDCRFIEAMSAFPHVRFHPQARSGGNTPLWNRHQASDNQSVAKDAILDCLTLSRCRYGLKCMSQLSAFSKIINPDLEIYRVSACKPGWFPEAYVPLYRSDDKAVRSLLRILQQDDFSDPPFRRAAGIHRRVARIARQVCKRRATLWARAKALLEK